MQSGLRCILHTKKLLEQHLLLCQLGKRRMRRSLWCYSNTDQPCKSYMLENQPVQTALAV